MLDAVRRATGVAGGAEPAAATPEFNARAMVDRVLSELGDTRGDLTLVIEDLHELASPGALAQLTRLLTSLPPGVHAIVSTRHDLRLRLHRLRLAGELSEIRAAIDTIRVSRQELAGAVPGPRETAPQPGTLERHEDQAALAAAVRPCRLC